MSNHISSAVNIAPLMILAGNRLRSAVSDEEVFQYPFTFDVGRVDNSHATFGGGGAQYCLGAMLARSEIWAAFDELFPRLASFTIGEPTATHPNLALNMYVYEHLPIQFAT